MATARTALIEPLAWDSAHFGVGVARLARGGVDLDAPAIAEALGEARRGGIALVLARVETDALAAAHRLEAVGFRLMDTLARYERSLREPVDAPASVRPADPDDAPAVEALAEETFAGYPGHFRNDARLDPRRADLVYVRWAVAACRAHTAGRRMFVAGREGRLAGFGVVELADGAAEGSLYAVRPDERGRGIGRALFAATVAWARGQGAPRMDVYSSLANPPPHRVWIDAGFAPRGGLHTFHAWLDETAR